MTDLENAKRQLLSGGYTCVLCGRSRQLTSQFRGVKPLVSWYHSGTDVSGFSAADKVVGRATAFLYVLLKVKAVYASVISRSALEVLAANGIDARYDTLVDNIINRRGDGICPFEEAVLDLQEPSQAYTAIRAKMAELNILL